MTPPIPTEKADMNMYPPDFDDFEAPIMDDPWHGNFSQDPEWLTDKRAMLPTAAVLPEQAGALAWMQKRGEGQEVRADVVRNPWGGDQIAVAAGPCFIVKGRNLAVVFDGKKFSFSKYAFLSAVTGADCFMLAGVRPSVTGRGTPVESPKTYPALWGMRGDERVFLLMGITDDDDAALAKASGAQ